MVLLPASHALRITFHVFLDSRRMCPLQSRRADPSPPKVNPLSGESAQASWYAGWKCGPVRLVSMAVSLLHHAAVFCGIRSQFKKFTILTHPITARPDAPFTDQGRSKRLITTFLVIGLDESLTARVERPLPYRGGSTRARRMVWRPLSTLRPRVARAQGTRQVNTPTCWRDFSTA